MTEFTPISGLLGGMLIGSASVMLLLGIGRIAGVSGIYGSIFTPARNPIVWRIAFVLGLLGGGFLWPVLSGKPLVVDVQVSMPVMLVAGFLVGLGARLGSGCTSGHGVSGIGRLSKRSLVATAVFMVAAVATTFVVRHVLGV
jgi:uncharacterized membrane protein YedE/YeeE